MNKIVLPFAVVALAALSVGCKSNKCCPPQQQACAPQPQPYCAPQAPVYYPPAPAEAYMPAPPPAPSQDMQLADMQSRALDAERKAREAAEERARKAEESARLAMAQPPSMGGWPAGGTDDQAMSFAEELRTRCDAEVVQSGNTVVIRMSDSFRAGSDQLKPDVKLATSLHAVADALMRYPGSQVAVTGHTDGTPIKKTKDKWTDNVHLSRARAETVARVLTEKGVGMNRMMVDGRGDVEPLVYPERTSSDRARNRRVEIHVRF